MELPLWRLGLLNADIVECAEEPPAELAKGLVAVGSGSNGRHLYADARRPQAPEGGWVGGASGLREISSTIRPLFHPFRYRVIHGLLDPLRPNITPLSTLTTAGLESYAGLVRRILGHIGEYLDSPEFLGRVEHLNDSTALAVATEPCVAERIFDGRFVLRTDDYSELGLDLDELFGLEAEDRWDLVREHLEGQIADLSKEVSSLYLKVGKERLEEEREKLVGEARRLDANTNVHIVLRLTKASNRLEFQGSLGGALLLNTMAETLRRQAEETLEEELNEEDEVGPVPRRKAFKKEIYGSDRLLDAEEAPRREFLDAFGLDRGVALRWYVEGETEAGALNRFIEEYGLSNLIQVVNYHGQIKKGRTEAFFEDLKRDLQARVFSYVSVDGDQEDTVRVVKQAAKNDLICGEFFISRPDFEFENFALEELEEVIWCMATHDEDPLEPCAEDRDRLHKALSGCSSGEELLRSAYSALPPNFSTVGKGEQWGRHLMEYAMGNSTFPDGKQRPVMDTAWRGVTARRSSYQVTRTEKRVDPETGLLVDR